MGPNYQRPEVTTPAGWRTPVSTADSLANLAWWDFYQDPTLTNLIATALANNHDLRLAAARIEEAMAGYRAQRALFLPALDASGNWTRTRSGYTGATGNNFDVFGLLSYEVDVWGRLRRLTEASRAQLLASEEGRRAVYIGLVASVAVNYFNLRALDEQLEIARHTLATRTNSLELTRIKLSEQDGKGFGIVSELDVKQAETQVHTARATIASLERAVAIAENGLSVLLGKNPGPIERGAPLAGQRQPMEIPAGLPSELLVRRPDLRAAEQNLITANANIGAARAAYFPTISLTAALGLQSLELDDLFHPGLSRAWKFAPQIAGPVFRGGQIRAGVRASEARQQAALATYEQAIQSAFREVDDALVSVAKLREQLSAQEANLAAERQRLELSRLRYEGGVASYSDVLDAERFAFSAELDAVNTRAELLSAVAQLYKALGGGWDRMATAPFNTARP
ncbi:MAG: efflux transporter outer membrane subunit [Verrucomicrobiae bacterium]|nr:efflux transporter outer membrane subunit [Verrucomicrobiae bacterium]